MRDRGRQVKTKVSETRKQRVQVMLEPGDKRELERRAKANRRSVSSQAEVLLRSGMKEG